MKVRISFTVDVDSQGWQQEYGVGPSEVRKDVQGFVRNNALGHLRDLGLLNEE